MTLIRNALAALAAGVIGMKLLAALLTPLIPLLIALLVMSTVVQLMTRRR